MPYDTEKSPKLEPMAKAGFTNWRHEAARLGERSLTLTLERLSPDDTPLEMNIHRATVSTIEPLGLPVQAHVSVSIGDFLTNPTAYLDKIPRGDYYFASIIPGVHIAHEKNERKLIDFIRNYVEANPDLRTLDTELYISHNGNPVMSGHIVIHDDGDRNIIDSEFTVGNFNAFHRGSHSPEISARRFDHRFDWDFRGKLTPVTADWRTSDEFECYGGTKLTRVTMAERIFETISHIPHVDNYYMPGYYEVLLERTRGDQTRPAFIEAIPLAKGL